MLIALASLQVVEFSTRHTSKKLRTWMNSSREISDSWRRAKFSIHQRFLSSIAFDSHATPSSDKRMFTNISRVILKIIQCRKTCFRYQIWNLIKPKAIKDHQSHQNLINGSLYNRNLRHINQSMITVDGDETKDVFRGEKLISNFYYAVVTQHDLTTPNCFMIQSHTQTEFTEHWNFMKR